MVSTLRGGYGRESEGSSYLVMQTHVSSSLRHNSRSLNDDIEVFSPPSARLLFALVPRSIDQNVKTLLRRRGDAGAKNYGGGG